MIAMPKKIKKINPKNNAINFRQIRLNTMYYKVLQNR